MRTSSIAILWVLILILCFNESSAQNRPTNEEEYNVEIIWSEARPSEKDTEADPNQNDPSWLVMTANDVDNLASELLSVNAQQPDDPPNNVYFPNPNPNAVCFAIGNDDDIVWYEVDSLCGVYTENITGLYDWDVMNFENDVQSQCVYHTGDDNLGRQYGTFMINDQLPGNDKTNEISVDNGTNGATSDGAKFRLTHRWRYSNGTKDSPLDFGLLTDLCTDYYHPNSTDSVGSSASETFYSDGWNDAIHSAFTDFADVSYTFELNDTRRFGIRMSTDSTGDYKPVVHIIALDATGNFLNYIGKKQSSYYYADLQAGNYGLVVEAPNSNLPTRGAFTMYLDIDECYPTMNWPLTFSDNIIYVNDDAPGGGDGSSWATAFCDLRFALELADQSNPIWIAGGTYYADQCDDRSNSFYLQDGIQIIGGFAGNESPNYNLSQRNFIANETILSGEIGNPNINTDNTKTIISAYNVTRQTVLDGLTIRDGYIEGDAAGMSIEANDGSEGPTLRNLKFISNDAVRGGAIRIVESGANIINCTFNNNRARDGDGGAISALESNLIISNCDFNNNLSYFGGGAIALNESQTYIYQSQFDGNSAKTGGAIHNIHYTASINIEESDFTFNTTMTRGGAIYNYGSAIALKKSMFFSNNAADDGGAIYNAASCCTINIDNCSFISNFVGVGSAGGALLFVDTINIFIANSTFYQNEAAAGGAIFGSTNSFLNLDNVILWNNTATSSGPNVYSFGSVVASNTLIEGALNWVSGATSETNMIYDQNPLFYNPSDPDGSDNICRTADDGFTLQSSSPAIDEGLILKNKTDDITRQKFINTPDIGAYEYPCSDINTISSQPDYTNQTISNAAVLTLTASNIISPSSNVYYQAGQSIMLEGGFEVKGGNIFEAAIDDGCPD